MEIKLIATDLDGTLLRNDRSVSEYTKEILKRFREKNGKVVLSTGRAFFGTEKIAEELEIEGIIITSNGAKIYDLEKNETLLHNPIEEEYTLKLIELSRKHQVHLNLYQENDWFVEDSQREESRNYTVNCGKEPIEKCFDEFTSYEMTKALFIGEPEHLKKVEEEIREKLGESVHITYSKSNFLEILNKKVNKGEALKYVAAHYRIEREQIAAFGDELNDREMLEFAHFGVAMKNANPELKKFVKYETVTNEEDGVAEFILKLMPELEKK